ncbi:DUF6029 family protein [Sinomicrobium sp. M5D2P17]
MKKTYAMVKKTGLLFLGLTLISNLSNAQISGSLESTGQRYVDDNKIQLDGEDAEHRYRSNSYLKLDYITGSWSFGVQGESYLPLSLLNYNPELKGVDIGTVYARYSNKKLGLDVTAGHFYEQFGSGLILRSWEDRQLGINNAILGGRVEYAPADALTFTFLGGRQRVGLGFDLSKGTLYGANMEAGLSDILAIGTVDISFGLSYVGRYEDYEHRYLNGNNAHLVNSYSGRLSVSKGGFYSEIEYVHKGKDLLMNMGAPLIDGNKKAGNAFLLDLGYARKGLGVNASLRRMENMRFYSQHDLDGNVFNRGVVNYVPALTKQYDYALQNIYVYQAQPQYQTTPKIAAGEIGGQLDLYYKFKKNSALGGKYGTQVALNTSYWGGLDIEGDPETGMYTTKALGFGDKYYNDMAVEVRKKWSKNWSSVFMYLNQHYNRGYIEGKGGMVNATTATAETTYKFGKSQSIRMEGQHQWVKDNFKNWAAATVEYGLDQHWSFYVHDSYNYGLDKIHYYNLGASFSKNSSRVALSYGRQRGGLLCVGGVCRMVTEAAGFTLYVSTSF